VPLSLLNPLWYAGALSIGLRRESSAMRGTWAFSPRRNTRSSITCRAPARLSESDARTRAIVEKMKQDEAGHAETAWRLGARELPRPVRTTMRLAARVMTTSSYWSRARLYSETSS